MGAKFKRITFEERVQIKALLEQGLSMRAISRSINKSSGAVCSEIKHGSRDGVYDPQYAQKRTEEKQRGKGREAVLADPVLAEYVAKLILEEKLTTLQIIKRLAAERHQFKAVPSSVNSIYRAIDEGLIPGVTRESLRIDRAKMFSNGMICVPSWIREELGLQDGDSFRIAVSPDGRISFKKVQEGEEGTQYKVRPSL